MIHLLPLGNYEIVLASKSPRRQQLFGGMELPFRVLTKEAEESFPDDMPPAEVAAYLSETKADAFTESELPENFLLISADTTVLIGDSILNKPADRAEAVQMLEQLSGKWHQVITGICFRTKTRKHVFSDCTEVLFDELTTAEIDWYVDWYKPFDKAGAYGIQEWIGYIGIRKIKGSFYNVMGLPSQKLYVELKNFLTNEAH